MISLHSLIIEIAICILRLLRSLPTTPKSLKSLPETPGSLRSLSVTLRSLRRPLATLGPLRSQLATESLRSQLVFLYH